MISTADLPSCSKMNMEGTKVGDVIISKYPVVVLTKLDPDIISVKVNTEDMQQFEKQQQGSSLVTLHKKANKFDNKSYGNDEDETLSDVSVSLSDDEKIALEEIESSGRSKKGGIEKTDDVKKNSEKIIAAELDKDQKKITSEKRKVLLVGKNKNDSISSSQKSAAQVKEIKKENLVEDVYKVDSGKPQIRASFKSDKYKALKQPAEIEGLSTTKSIKKEAAEKINPNQEHTVKDKKHNPNARYKLALDPVSVSALESESFRKFINLASDCVIGFNKKQTALSSLTGNVVLFFGDCMTLQSAIQRLSQLTVFADKSLVKGTITCMEVKQLSKDVSKDQKKPNLTAKLFFQFSTDKSEKLQQLISSKGRKKEDTKRKCVQVHRIPSSINEEMLSLLFPFSVGVKISGTESAEKDIKGPVEIEFENQEWMEAVLTCFKDFSVSTIRPYDRIFNLIIKNFIPPKEKPRESTLVSTMTDRQKQVTGGLKRGNLNQRERTINRGLLSTRNLATGLERKSRPLLQRTIIDKPGLAQNRDVQRKRTYPGLSFGQRGMDIRELAAKRSRIDNATQARGLARTDMIMNDAKSQQFTQAEVHQDALRQIAHSRGLDSSNPDVIKIMEMTTHLEKLQNLAVQQTVEANSLGFVGLQGQQVVNEQQLQLQQQVLALKQAQEEAEVRRYQAAVQAQNLHLRELEEANQARNSWPQSENLWQSLEVTRRREEEERKQLEEYQANMAEINRKEIISGRLQQLEEIELLSRQGIPFQRESHRGNDTDSRLARNYFSKKGEGSSEYAANKIQAFGHAPATSGLLGAAPMNLPSVLDEQQMTHENMYTANDGSGFSNQDRLMLEKNMPHRKSLRQQNVSHDQFSSSRPVSRTQRLSTKFPQKSPNSVQTLRKRSQDMRNNEGSRQTQGISVQRKFTGKKSRWDTVEDPNSFGQIPMEPDRNDKPLDFNRSLGRLTTEQAFKQDIERTRAVLATHGNAATGRSFKSQPILKTTKPLLEEVRDRHGLPVQFGKNAAKRVPRQIQDDRRKNVQMNQNTIDSFTAGINARNLSSVNSFKNVIGMQDQSFTDRWDSGSHRGGSGTEEFQDKYKGPSKIGDRRKSFGAQRDMANARSSRGLLGQGGGGLLGQGGEGLLGQGGEMNLSTNLPRGGISISDVHRDRLFNNGQASALNRNKSEQVDAYEFDTQWRRNIQETTRNSEMASNREQESARGQASTIWQQLRERQMYSEHGQEKSQGQLYPESDFDYGRNEWNKHGGHFLEKGSGYRVAEKHSERSVGMVTGLQAKPSQLYEDEGQLNSYSGTARNRRPYQTIQQKFTRAEKGQGNYGEYEDPDHYAGETSFGKESYQTQHGFGAGKRGNVSQSVGPRGGLLGRDGGHGNVSESVQGRGLLSFRNNVQQGSGRGLLELPEHFKQQEGAYYGEGNDARYMHPTAAETGHYQAHQLQSLGRNSLVPPPPLPPMLGHGVNFF